jgi:hypothetical protein
MLGTLLEEVRIPRGRHLTVLAGADSRGRTGRSAGTGAEKS